MSFQRGNGFIIRDQILHGQIKSETYLIGMLAFYPKHLYLKSNILIMRRYALLKRPNIWLHVTGISPLTGANPKYNWKRAIEIALELGVPVRYEFLLFSLLLSMDLNHRKLLGPLNSLWKITTPFLPKMKLLILSLDSLRGIAQLEGFSTPQETSSEADPSWVKLMSDI